MPMSGKFIQAHRLAIQFWLKKYKCPAYLNVGDCIWSMCDGLNSQWRSGDVLSCLSGFWKSMDLPKVP